MIAVLKKGPTIDFSTLFGNHRGFASVLSVLFFVMETFRKRLPWTPRRGFQNFARPIGKQWNEVRG